jgi:hypothetical protein
MSYPKRPPGVTGMNEHDAKHAQRRDQMRNLLINKFRGKYNVQADN